MLSSPHTGCCQYKINTACSFPSFATPLCTQQHHHCVYMSDPLLPSCRIEGFGAPLLLRPGLRHNKLRQHFVALGVMVGGSRSSFCTLYCFVSIKFDSSGKMEMTTEWEQVLDAIAGEIRDALSVEASTDDSLPCARALRPWVDTLIRLLVEHQRLNDPDGATEVLDVFASLLKASADGRWRHRQEGAAESDRVYSRGRLEMIVKAMHAAVSTVADTQSTESDEIRTHVITILASLFFNATHEVEVDVLLSILCLGLRGTPLENAISYASHALSSDSMLEGTAWDACYVKFVLRFRFSSATPEYESKNLEVLRLLTGTPNSRVNDWIIETWETKWHLHRSARVRIPLFGPVENCVATIRKLFQGFSIGQDDVEFKNEAAVIMALRDANKHFGLVHGVDVTLIKDGHVHPSWKDSGRKIRMEDVDRALEEGYTIGVRSVQARSLPVFELCSKLQRELGQHVNANLYWTPPGQQGFDRHVDDHCVFAIQLKGRKRWVLYEPQELLPLLFDDTTPHLSTQAPRFHTEVILEEGDVLYVPRGVAHHADTKNIHEEAIHLTIGIEIDAANTNGRILEKLQDTELVCSDNVKHRGLMAWHLTNPSAFRSHVASFRAIESRDTLQRMLASIHHELKNEREVFLAQRSVRASTMAMLHEIVQEVCYEQSPVGMESDAIRPSKKQRQS